LPTVPALRNSAPNPRPAGGHTRLPESPGGVVHVGHLSLRRKRQLPGSAADGEDVRNSETGRRRRRTVRGRLHGLAAVAALFTALVGGVGLSGYAGLNAANSAENRLGTIQSLELEAQSEQHAIRGLAWFAISIGTHGTDRPMSEVREEFAAARDRLRAVQENLAGIVDGTTYAQRFQEAASAENEIVALAEEAIGLATVNREQALIRIDRLETAVDELDADAAGLTADLRADRDRRMAATHRLTRSDSLRLLAAAVLATVLVFALSTWLGRSILTPLKAVADVARRIGSGDPDARCALTGQEETDAVARALNTTAEKLSASMDHLAAEARRERLGSQLTEAFDMAESEAEAYAVVGRTLHQLDPQRPAELLLADNSRARLGRKAASGPDEPPCCPVTSPYSCVAVRRGHATVFEDSDALNACPKLKDRPAGRMSAVCVPVTFMGRSLGVVHITGAPGQRPSDDALAALSVLAGQTGSRIGTLRSFAQAQLQASTDGLTGLRNRRAFETEARQLLLAGGRAAIVMADLDNFKLLNDTHGHEAGDRALRRFGQALRQQLREQDITGRIGGEEFGMVLHDLAPDEAVAVIERLREALHEPGDGATPSFTASFGISCTDGHTGFDDLLRSADRALYRSKHDGRDRITLDTQLNRPQPATATADAYARAVRPAG
jgi:diguanylate cyclase (GGDEF)-like protein